MVLYIGGKSYSNKSDLLGAVKNLPSPFLDVITDFDDKIYTMHHHPDDLGFLISRQESDDFKNIIGKSDHIFSRESRIDDKEAYCINQGDVGFISNGKIGTSDVYDCVALIIQDKKSKKQL